MNGHNGQQKKILLVDDEPNILVALEFLMQQEGYQVQTANNGREALNYMKNFIPDIVILDVMMPGMDGFEVANNIRTNNTFQSTQIIFLTAKGTPEDRWRGYSNGGEIYLTKPFDNDELVTIVKELLNFGSIAT